MSRPYDWNQITVCRILSRPEYKGCTVNFRTTTPSYKDRKAVYLPPEDWLVFENTHEAIVDPETWALAQHVRKTTRRTDSNGMANPLTGIMYCADCGQKMYNHKEVTLAERKGRPRDPVSGLYPYDNYECSSYNRTRTRVQRQCTPHRIPTSSVRSLLLETIRYASQSAISDPEAFAQKIREASSIQQAATAKETEREIDKATRRIRELDVLIKKLYESYATGKMPEKRYETLSAEYEQEQADLIELVEQKQAIMQEYQSDSENIDRFMALAEKYSDFTVLTNEMINEFVDKILVHSSYKDEYGDRTQEIEIYLKFIGKVEMPIPELTPEELAEQERKRQARLKARAYYSHRKEQQKEKTSLSQAEADTTTKGASNQGTLSDAKTA